MEITQDAVVKFLLLLLIIAVVLMVFLIPGSDLIAASLEKISSGFGLW